MTRNIMKKYSLIWISLLTGIILNLQLLNIIAITSLLFIINNIIFFISQSYIFSNIKKNSKHYFPYSLIYSFLLTISSAIIYFFWDLNNLAIISVINFCLIISIFIHSKYQVEKALKSGKKLLSNVKNSLNELKLFYKKPLLTLYLFSTAVLLLILVYNRFDFAVRTFWTLLPFYFLPLYLVNTFILFKINQFYPKRAITSALNILHLNISLGLALILYKYAYGFDPFIHQSTMKSIAKNGSIQPKSYYYLGYYSFIVIINKLSHIAIKYLDKFIFLLTFNLLFLKIFYKFLIERVKNTNKNFLLLIFLIFPFTLFITSTPQAIANIITLSAIFYALNKNSKLHLLALLNILTLVIHPLSGIPLFFIIIFLKFKHKIIKVLSFIALSLALPASFLMFNFIQTNFVKFNFNLQALKDFFSQFKFTWPQQFIWWKDLIYIYLYNLPIILLIVIIGSIFIFRKNKMIKELFYLHLALLISYLLSLNLQFQQLINYEQQNYNYRILLLAIYCLYPIIILLIAKLYTKHSDKLSKNVLWLILSILILMSVYASYPRDDQYHLDRGYNLCQADISAVRYIQKNTQKKFLVLAPQMTSVAALNEFGFYNQIENKKKEKLFYYPIPTSGELYKSYLEIVYEDQSRAPIDEIFANYNVQRVYVVLPHYWHNATNLILNLQKSADDWLALENNQIYIFAFDR